MKTHLILAPALALATYSAGIAAAAGPTPVTPEAIDKILADGAWRGRLPNQKNARIELLSKAIPQRKGSYLMILTQGEKFVCIYQADPASADPRNAKLSLVPLKVNAEGYIATDDARPPINLNFSDANPHDPQFTINGAGSGNTYCLTQAIEFKGRSSNYQWSSELRVGGFREENKRRITAFQIGAPMGGNEFDGSREHVLSSIQSRQGLPAGADFSLRESYPNVFTMRITRTMDIGEIRDRNISGIFVPMTFRGRYRLFEVNPENPGLVIKYRPKN